MLALLLVAFVAGVLTIAAPCVLPLIPVVVGGSIARTASDGAVAERQWYRPLLIATGLAVSVVVFTLLLKATTALLGVPQQVWQVVAGVIVALFGLTLVFPSLWERLMLATGLQARTGTALDRSSRVGGPVGDLLLGAALGPTFSSCSPTYALIVATVLPASFGEGLAAIVVYALGLAGAMLVVAALGQAAARRLGWLTRPDGWFRRIVGIVMILVGVAVALGVDRLVQAWVLEAGWYDGIEQLERSLLG
ncbi:MAG: sulfite exporter TauE/SafE family protein [Actinomycetales bacterium]|nr:sulfite exporter TauE/SafE family protein [Actinomycetales bacterium]